MMQGVFAAPMPSDDATHLACALPIRLVAITSRIRCRARALWDGEERTARVYAIGNEPLVGMALLRGSRVTMDVAEGGAVEIEPL